MNNKISYKKVIIIIFLTALNSCSFYKASISNNNPWSIPTSTNDILIFPANIEYKNTYTEKNIPATEIPKSLSSSFVATIIADELIKKGATVTGLKDIDSSQLNAVMAKIKNDAKSLTKKFRNNEHLLSSFQDLKNKTNIQMICFLNITINIGDNSFYSPVALAPAQLSTHSSQMTIALLSLKDGKCKWHNELFVRKIVNSENISKYIKKLLKSIK